MNQATTAKYKQMLTQTSQIRSNLEQIDIEYEQVLPKLSLIDKLDGRVSKLEKMAYSMDAYSKRLGLF